METSEFNKQVLMVLEEKLPRVIKLDDRARSDFLWGTIVGNDLRFKYASTHNGSVSYTESDLEAAIDNKQTPEEFVDLLINERRI